MASRQAHPFSDLEYATVAGTSARTILFDCGRSRKSWLTITAFGFWREDLYLAQRFFSKTEVVERLVIGRLVPPEPLPNARHVPWAHLLHVLDIVEFLGQRVVHINGDHLRETRHAVSSFEGKQLRFDNVV